MAPAEQVGPDEHDTTPKGFGTSGILATIRRQWEHQHSAYFTTDESSAQGQQGKNLSDFQVSVRSFLAQSVAIVGKRGTFNPCSSLSHQGSSPHSNTAFHADSPVTLTMQEGLWLEEVLSSFFDVKLDIQQGFGR
jgi:hypothetical protein